MELLKRLEVKLSKLIRSDNVSDFSDFINKHKININYKISKSIPLIVYAASYSSRFCVEFLIENKANVNDQSLKDGTSAIFHAYCEDDNFMIDCLTRTNINLDIRSDYGQTPLMYAIRFSSFLNISKAIKLTKNLNNKDDNGNTAMTFVFSCERGSSVAKLLIENGYDYTLLDVNGNNTLNLLCQKKVAAGTVNEKNLNESIDYILNKSTININHKNNAGQSAIISAAITNKKNVVKRLLSMNPTLKSSSGKNILDFNLPPESCALVKHHMMSKNIEETKSAIPSLSLRM